MSMLQLIPGLNNLLDYFRQRREHQSAQKTLALGALMLAVTETRLYLRNYSQSRRRSKSREEKLVRLWAAAAVPLAEIDQDLAQRCTMKADYWLNPTHYSDAEIQHLRIGIDDVYRETKGLL